MFHSPPAFWDHHPNILYFPFTFHLVTFPMVKQEYSIGFRKPWKVVQPPDEALHFIYALAQGYAVRT